MLPRWSPSPVRSDLLFTPHILFFIFVLIIFSILVILFVFFVLIIRVLQIVSDEFERCYAGSVYYQRMDLTRRFGVGHDVTRDENGVSRRIDDSR